MFSEKNIIITIGNSGVVVAFHEGIKIKNKIFIENLNEESKAELKKVFTKNQSYPAYILIDTADQSYKRKIYPSVRRSDLERIIRRDMSAEGTTDGIKNYMILPQKKQKAGQKTEGRKWECLFISSSISDEINDWIDFVLDMPNRLIGIYMLPIESFNLFKLLENNIKSGSKAKNKTRGLCCMIMQNKVSGIRQMVFSEQGIIFTRIVNYNFLQSDFIDKYEQDIYSTFEYLKRLFPDLGIFELDIVSIFPTEVLNLIKKIQNLELSMIYYTPLEAATEAGYKGIIPNNGSFCDLLISKTFSNQKKILKFSLPKISSFDKFFIILRGSFYANITLISLSVLALIFTVFSKDQFKESTKIVETQKLAAMEEMKKIKSSLSESDQYGEPDADINIEKILDLGKLDESLGKVGIDYKDRYTKLKFIKDFDTTLYTFSHVITGINSKSPSSGGTNYKTIFYAIISNKTGDIEDLFREFDALTAEAKKTFPQERVVYSNLPKNMDFGQKYYSFPVNFTVTKAYNPNASNN